MHKLKMTPKYKHPPATGVTRFVGGVHRLRIAGTHLWDGECPLRSQRWAKKS